jgi:hypothetical protein
MGQSQSIIEKKERKSKLVIHPHPINKIKGINHTYPFVKKPG